MFAVAMPARVRSFVPAVPDARAWTRVAVAVGLVVRVWHYLQNHTIWYDEAVLLDNVMAKGFAGLVGPLANEVAAPPLFVWLLRLVFLACGDEPYAWRFVPFVCGCGTLLLSVPLARRVLSPGVVPVAVGLVAVSDSHVWLGCTVKPYAGDALAATVLLYGFVATADWRPGRRLWLLAAATPFALGVSYPAAFVVGGLLAAMLFAWRLSAWWAAVISAAGTFAALYFGPVRSQRVAKLVDEWARDFPNWNAPFTVPGWAAEHTLTAFQYCYLPAGIVLGLLAPVGAVAAWRADRRGLVAAAGVPFLLVLAAAAGRAYPYGYNRLMLFVAPSALILGGLGLGAVLSRFPKAGYRLAVLVLVVNCGPIVMHTVKPWPKPDAAAVTKFVNANRRPGDVVASDEGNYLYFFPGERRPLLEAAAGLPPGGRVWAVMDHYTPEIRRAYVAQRLEPAGLVLVRETPFRDATAFLYIKPGAE